MSPAGRGADDGRMLSHSSPTLTAAATRMISDEVARLRALMEREFTDRRREALAVAQGDGDAHLAIGEDEIVVQARIAHLEALLRHATVVEDAPAHADAVALGSRVTVEDVATGRRQTYTLVPWNDGAAGAVSAASPVGQAILGRTAGEEVTIVLPAGRSLRLRICAHERSPLALL